MCKLEGLKWAVVKSNTTISKSLSKRLNNARNGSTQENTFSFYYFKDSDFENILEVLRDYKKMAFEVVRFYDKQFGLTLNFYAPKEIKTEDLPLSKRFFWFNGSQRQAVTQITQKQFDNIIYIN